MTLDCLASLRDETRADFETIVVDNASTDGSAEAIAAALPRNDSAGRDRQSRLRRRQQPGRTPRAGRISAAAQPRHAGARRRRRPASGLRAGQSAGRNLGRAHALRRPEPQSGLLLGPHDALEPVLPRLGPDGRLSALGALQFRGLWRLGPRIRARGRHRHGLLPDDPARDLGGARRLRSRLLHVRRGGRSLPARARARRGAPGHARGRDRALRRRRGHRARRQDGAAPVGKDLADRPALPRLAAPPRPRPLRRPGRCRG